MGGAGIIGGAWCDIGACYWAKDCCLSSVSPWAKEQRSLYGQFFPKCQKLINRKFTLIEKLALDCFEVGIACCLCLTPTFRIYHLLLEGILWLRKSCLGMILHVRWGTWWHLDHCWRRAVIRLLLTAVRKATTTSTTSTSDITLPWDRLWCHAAHMSAVHHLRLHSRLSSWFCVLNRSLCVINLFFRDRLKNHICG